MTCISEVLSSLYKMAIGAMLLLVFTFGLDYIKHSALPEFQCNYFELHSSNNIKVLKQPYIYIYISICN